MGENAKTNPLQPDAVTGSEISEITKRSQITVEIAGSSFWTKPSRADLRWKFRSYEEFLGNVICGFTHRERLGAKLLKQSHLTRAN
jgi:hypothetical protein